MRASEAADRRRRIILWARQMVAVAVLLTIIAVRLLVYRPVEVKQNSMKPTLKEGQRLLVNTWIARDSLPPRGAVVVLRKPDSAVWVVKRVIGLPGDQLLLTNQGVSVNGKRLTEPYAVPYDFPTLSVKVPPNQFWVLGDNRPESEDSRDYGPVPAERLIGVVSAVFYPWAERHWLTPDDGSHAGVKNAP